MLSLPLQGTPAFRAHAAKIFNIFTTVIDALDKDDKEMKGIKRILVEGEFEVPATFPLSTCFHLFPVGKTHAKRRISKQAQNDLRSVVVQIVSDVCKIDDEGTDLHKINAIKVLTSERSCRQNRMVEAVGRFLPRNVRVPRRAFRAILLSI